MYKRFVAYLRVSTDEQGEDGLSMISQQARITMYCSLYNLELVDIIKEVKSGKTLDRPGLQEALKQLQDGMVDGLICAKLDRLTRSVKDLGTLIETYFNNGHPLVVVAEQIDTTTPGGRLVANLLASVAQWERETISQRTKDALQALKRSGKKLGSPKLDRTRSSAWAAHTVKATAFREQVLPIIQNIQKAGLTTYDDIATALNARGIKTGHDRKWHASTVRNFILGLNIKTMEEEIK
jgi:DNA invertase Pin-like site-specific DNA recombinase